MNKQLSSSDARLVNLAQNGDAHAYNTLLERYHHKIKQIIYFYINDQAHVNDLTQEVLLKIFKNLHYFKQDSEFSTWLYRITLNTVKNYFRAINLRIDSESQFAKEQYLLTYSPEHQLIDRELLEQLNTAITRLSDELRLCYGMHTFDGDTYEDIAQKMHCPIGTVRSRIFRARKLILDYISQN